MSDSMAILRQINADAENTENKTVDASVKLSIRKLKVRYPSLIENAHEEIFSLLEKQPESHKRTLALQAFNHINTHSQPQEGKELTQKEGLTLQQALWLIWTALQDKTLESLDTHANENALFESLADMRRSHGYFICENGIFNKIVETLDRIHPDVLIHRHEELALQEASSRARQLLYITLQSKERAERNEIISEWEDEKGKNFINECKVEITEKLKKEYGIGEEKNEIITLAQLGQIIGNDGKEGLLDYATKPIFNERLKKLKEDIDNLENQDIPSNSPVTLEALQKALRHCVSCYQGEDEDKELNENMSTLEKKLMALKTCQQNDINSREFNDTNDIQFKIGTGLNQLQDYVYHCSDNEVSRIVSRLRPLSNRGEIRTVLDSNGNTLLHLAVAQRNKNDDDIAKLVTVLFSTNLAGLEKNPATFAENKEGLSPIKLANSRGYTKTKNLMIQKLAEIHRDVLIADKENDPFFDKIAVYIFNPLDIREKRLKEVYGSEASGKSDYIAIQKAKNEIIKIYNVAVISANNALTEAEKSTIKETCRADIIKVIKDKLKTPEQFKLLGKTKERSALHNFFRGLANLMMHISVFPALGKWSATGRSYLRIHSSQSQTVVNDVWKASLKLK